MTTPQTTRLRSADYSLAWTPERQKKYMKIYQAVNKDELAAYNHEYYVDNKEELKIKNGLYYQNNKEIIKLKLKQYRDQHKGELKKEVLSHYSPSLKCNRCGFSDLRALSIDHIEGGGNKHRKEQRGSNIYLWLRRNGYPRGFQVLCMNCQFIKRIENKEFSKRPQTL